MDSDGYLARNFFGEFNCVYNHVEWYTKYPPIFEFLLDEFHETIFNSVN
jgi:hypothetical protein